MAKWKLWKEGPFFYLAGDDLPGFNLGEGEEDSHYALMLRELLADANRGAESAAYDKAINNAAERATDEASELSPAALAHGLACDAVALLASQRPPAGGSYHYQVPRVLVSLSKALRGLNEIVVYEQRTGESVLRPLPPQPLEEAIAEAHGLTPEGAEE